MAIGFDAPRHRVVVFGGTGPRDDTWAYDLLTNAWTQLNTAAGAVKPPARFSMVFGTDHARHRLMIAAGEGADRTFFNDAWSFDFATELWAPLNPSGDAPPVRYGAAGGVANGGDGTLWVSHGFYGLTRLSDTYGVSPTPGSPFVDRSPAAASSVPFARCLVGSAVTAPQTVGGSDEYVVMFGGCGSLGHGPCPANDVWRFNTATRVWDEMGKCPGPRNRATFSVFPTAITSAGGAATTNASLERELVLVGGSGGIFGNGLAGEVNWLDAFSGEWRRVAPTGADADGAVPSAGLDWPGLVAIPADSGVAGAPFVLMFGGEGSTALWRLAGNPHESEALQCPYVFPIREFHGALMFLSWGFLLPVGVMLARYGKALQPHDLWFKLHRGVQSLGVVLSIGGFIAAVLMVRIHPMKLAHHFIGVVVFAIGILQPLNALCRPHPTPRTTARAVWEAIHKNAGRVGVVLGMLNCIIGLFLIHASVAPIVLYLIWCFAVVVFVVVKEVQMYRNPPPQSATASSDASAPAADVALAPPKQS